MKKNLEFNHKFLEDFKYQTPFFVFSKERILDKLQEFKKCFPGAVIHYAMKANSEPEILETVAQAGAGFEVASLYEFKMLKDIKVPANKIIYGTSIKPAAHIKEVFKYGVDRFVFDSPAELEKIAAVAPGARVYIRVSVNDAGSVFRFSEKFGTDKEHVVPWLLHAKELGLRPYGISFHVGSQASNVLAWANALKSLHKTLVSLKEVGIKIDIINIGGGYPCPYASAENDLSLKDIAEKTYKEYKKLPYQPKLILEPGRGVIASAAVLVTSVIGRVDRKGSTWLFLDAGVYNALFETMAYQGSTRYRITSLRAQQDAGESMFALAGPTGDSPDIISHEALLPSDTEVGDRLVVHDVGAYSLAVSSRFNGFSKPRAILVDTLKRQ